MRRVSGDPEVGWGDLRDARPDLEAAGRSFMYHYGIGLGFLATVRPDGGPRVHPISPIITHDALFSLIVPGPKLNDLRRDGRYALHSETLPPPRHDDAFYISGRAIEIDEQGLWDQIAEQLLAERDMVERWPGFERQVLFELRLDRCLLTLTMADERFPAGHTVWHPG